MKDFRDLKVWHKAHHVALACYTLTRSFPRDEIFGLVSQIRRCGASVAANIAEGCGRGTYQDNRRFVRIARGSLYETRHWLRRAFRRKLLTDKQIQALKPLVDNLGPQLNAYLKSIGMTRELGDQ